MPLGGVATGLLVESHEGRPTKIEGNPLHPGSLGATDVFAQAAILGLYDPDRSQTLTNLGEIRPWSAFLGAIRAALAAQQPLKGAGLRILTESVSSPTLAAQIRDLLARFPSAKWHQWDPASREQRARRREARVRRVRRRAVPLRSGRRHPRRSTPTSSAAARAALRYARDFAARRRPEQADRMNRLYALETMPTLDRRARRSSPAAAAERDRGGRAAIAAAVGVGRRRSGGVAGRAAEPTSPMDRRGREGSAGASRREPRHRRRRPAAGRPRARARDERGARQRRHDRRLHASRSKPSRSISCSRCASSSPT